jgi:hypothetical protein
MEANARSIYAENDLGELLGGQAISMQHSILYTSSISRWQTASFNPFHEPT